MVLFSTAVCEKFGVGWLIFGWRRLNHEAKVAPQFRDDQSHPPPVRRGTDSVLRLARGDAGMTVGHRGGRHHARISRVQLQVTALRYSQSSATR